MKRLVEFLFLAVIMAVIPTVSHAQDLMKIDLTGLDAGTEFEGGNLCALMSEQFLESDEGQSLLNRMNSFLTGMAYSIQAGQLSQSLEGLKNLRKQYAGKTDPESLEYIEYIDGEISHYEEVIRQCEGMATDGGSAEELIREVRSHSLGERLYYGADYIEHGCWAVGMDKEYRTPNSKCGVISSDGQVVVPFIYNCLEAYPDEKIIRTIDCGKGKMGMIRYDGSVILDCRYDLVNMSPSALIIIDNNGNESRCGVADMNGNIVIPQIYSEIEPFLYVLESGTYEFYVVTDGKTGLKAVFDRSFKQITGFVYDGWLNEKPYFIGVRSDGQNDVYDARLWQKLEGGIPEEYWDHRYSEE